jgi:hypothetical protein
MATYRIVCTTKAPADKPPSHQHIVGVGTGEDPDHADRRWALQAVLDAMRRGDAFHTIGIHTGVRAEVERYWCAKCARWFIRSEADAALDDNLDNLRRCRFKRS